MGNAWPQIIYDPVHKVVAFSDTPCDRLLLELINTKEFQRLRRIKQLGMSDLVFPGSSHTRFAHSIGVLNMARKFIARVRELELSPALTPEQETVILVASLLHDVGHGPFSHAFEKVIDKNHEEWTLEIILDESTDVNRALRGLHKDLPRSLEVFFIKESENPSSTTNGAPSKLIKKWQIPPWMKQIVSSQFDADRFDYLLRDSYSSGAQYGSFDVDWLLRHLHLDEKYGRFYLHTKALYAAEAYVYARYHMYQTVYFHKTTRAAEVMLKLFFARFKELIQGTKTIKAREKLVPLISPLLLRAFSGSISMADYLELDDITMWEFIKRCQIAKDPILSELSSGLVNRKLYKAIDLTGEDLAVQGEFKSLIEQIYQKRGLNLRYHGQEDRASDTPYKLPYYPGGIPEKQIFVGAPGVGKRELSQESESVKVLAKTFHVTRYYFPEYVRKEVRMCLEKAKKKAKK